MTVNVYGNLFGNPKVLIETHSMSKAAKISILLLILVIASFGALAFITLQKNTQLTDTNTELQNDLEAANEREVKHMRDIKSLGDKVKSVEAEKTDLVQKLKEASLRSENLMRQVKDIERERDKWKARIDVVSKERDDIVQQTNDLKSEVASLQKQVEAKNKELAEAASREKSEEIASSQTKTAETAGTVKIPESKTTSQSGMVSSSEMDEENPYKEDQYWATILKNKAELEVKLDQLDEALAKKSIEIVEFKQKNADMQIEIESLKTMQENLNDQIKYKSDLVNNLSLELARTKNDRKFIAEKMNKVAAENNKLRREMKTLVSTKGALQKSIVKLTQDKNKVEKELGTTESIIQSKIDEIWEIKDSLDQTFQQTASTVPISDDIELPPIHVNAKGAQVPYDLGAASPGYNGRVVSINEDNNFVIVDIGKSKGVNLGEALSVYRDSKYIARLEVIQVRNDISAADVRDQWSRIQVGDIVR